MMSSPCRTLVSWIRTRSAADRSTYCLAVSQQFALSESRAHKPPRLCVSSLAVQCGLTTGGNAAGGMALRADLRAGLLLGTWRGRLRRGTASAATADLRSSHSK